MRPSLQPLLEVVADDHPTAPLLPGLGPDGLDEARGERPTLVWACRAGVRALLADGVAPTPVALAQRLCRVRGYGYDSIGVAMTDLVEGLAADGDVAFDLIVFDTSRLTMVALAEVLIGMAQLMAAPTGEAPSRVVAGLLDDARRSVADDDSDAPDVHAEQPSGDADREAREAS